MSDKFIYRVVVIVDRVDKWGEDIHTEHELNVYTTLSAAKGARTRKINKTSPAYAEPGYSREVVVQKSPLAWTTVDL